MTDELIDELPEDLQEKVRRNHEQFGYESPDSFIVQSTRLHINDLIDTTPDIRYNIIDDGNIHLGFNNYSGKQYMLRSDSNHIMFGESNGVVKLWASRLAEWLKPETEKVVIFAHDDWYDNLQKLNISDLGGSGEWSLEQVIINEKTPINPIDVRKPSKPPSTLKGEQKDEFVHLIQTPEERDKYTKEQYMKLAENFYRTLSKYSDVSMTEEEIKTLLRATKIAYGRSDISNNFSTHDKQSPTLSDVARVVQEMASNQGVIEQEISPETEKRAEGLAEEIQPFVDDERTENMTMSTRNNFVQQKVNWVDISQLKKKEHFVTMHAALINTYLQACETQESVHIVIDNADRLLSEEQTLETLELMVVNGEEFDVHFTFGSQNPELIMRGDSGRFIQNYVPHVHYYERMVQYIEGMTPDDPLKEFDPHKSEGSEKLGCIVRDNTYYPIRISPDRLEAPLLGRKAYSEFFKDDG